jgi:hypothetical protein
MTSRERVRKAINFEEPDRVPLDLGGSCFLTSICAGAYNQVKKRLGFSDLPTEVWAIMTMTVFVEEPIRQALGLDVVCISASGAGFGMKHDNYAKWNLPSDGSEVRMPPGFRVRPTEDGGWLLEGGWPMYMPKNGHYFDAAFLRGGTQLLDGIADSPPKQDLKELRRQQAQAAPPARTPGLDFVREQARHYYHNSDYSLMYEALAGGLPSGEGIAALTNVFTLMRQDPGYVHEWFDVLADAAIARLGPLLDAVEDHCDVIMVTCCDFGSQQCEFIPPELFKEFYVQPYRKINDYVHRNSNMKTCFHSCGAISRLIPHFIEAGVDALNPMQTSAAGMEPERLKRACGDKMVIWGAGVETQTTLPFGTVDDVVAEVTERVEILKPGGGFIFNPVHNVQDLVSPEKIIAAYETARKVGVYG